MTLALELEILKSTNPYCKKTVLQIASEILKPKNKFEALRYQILTDKTTQIACKLSELTEKGILKRETMGYIEGIEIYGFRLIDEKYRSNILLA